MAFGDVVQTAQTEGITQFQFDLSVSAPTSGNLLVILISAQGNVTMNAGSFEAGFTERFNVNNANGIHTSRLVLYDKISDGTEGTTIHVEWTDFNSASVTFVEFAAAGAIIAHDVSGAQAQTDTGSTMASGNVDPTDGQQSIVLGLFGRVLASGVGSSYSAGTIKSSTTGVTEAKDYGPTFWVQSIQELVDANVASGNYNSGVTVADNISGNDVGVAGIAIYKGGAGSGGVTASLFDGVTGSKLLGGLLSKSCESHNERVRKWFPGLDIDRQARRSTYRSILLPQRPGLLVPRRTLSPVTCSFTKTEARRNVLARTGLRRTPALTLRPD